MPAEWHRQSFVQFTWPDKNTDWTEMLDEVLEVYYNMVYETARRENVLIITSDIKNTQAQLNAHINTETLHTINFLECPINDTWARDHSFITCLRNGKPIYKDFMFNGWGLKYPANHDNLINRRIHKAGILSGGEYENCLSWVLEGGSIESDGNGTLLTTSSCIMAPNRNEGNISEATEHSYEHLFYETLGFHRVLWLHHGHLDGDDTDGHIDTLARFCDRTTIAYVQCTEKSDSHYEDLKLMEEELKTFTTEEGKPYRLIPLPMTDPIYHDGERLPSTYANFLIINGAVLCPTYNQSANDKLAIAQLQKAFPYKEIIGIDCRALIRQHGSLHCSTMQYPASDNNANE